MDVSLVTTKGRVVIPVMIRRKYGIKAGAKIYFSDDNNKIIMHPITEKTIDLNKGILGTKGRLLRKLMEEKLSILHK